MQFRNSSAHTSIVDSGPHLHILDACRIEPSKARDELERQLAPADRKDIEQLTVSPSTKQIVQAALAEAQRSKDFEISTTHILIGLIE